MLKIQYRRITPLLLLFLVVKIYENNSLKETNVIISLLM